MTSNAAYPTLASSFSQLRPTGRQLTALAKANPLWAVGIGAVLGLGAAALINRRIAANAERDNPPAGKFLTIDGCRLHYVEKGVGDPLVLLHGNGSMIQDFTSSGLIELAAQNHRVIAFDRPGYGYSDRPRSTIWTADAQADLISTALKQMSVPPAVVLGHSWGASVAVALALKHPELVRGLVLASGFYYPEARADVVMMSGPAIPVIGDVVRFTLAPLLSRMMWPVMMRKIFGPRPVPAKFASFPKEMALRPSTLRAAAAEAALMMPGAYKHSDDYRRLTMPVTIVAGDDDRLIDIDQQSARLHRDISQSKFHRLAGEGHMIQQTATASVMAAIDSMPAAALQ